VRLSISHNNDRFPVLKWAISSVLSICSQMIWKRFLAQITFEKNGNRKSYKMSGQDESMVKAYVLRRNRSKNENGLKMEELL
jgi:hypothetical protein